MTERKFTRALSKIGSAAQARENASLAVRESLSARTHLVEPIDYENFLQERYNFIVNDSQKDMILFPRNDFKMERKSHQKEGKNTLPKYYNEALDSPLSKECIKIYNEDWHIIDWLNLRFSGSFYELPKSIVNCDDMKAQVIESQNTDEIIKSSQFEGIIKLEQYALETEFSISVARKESRVNLFSVYPDLLTRKGTFIKLKEEDLNNNDCFDLNKDIQFLFKCNQVDFGLKLEDGTPLEPYFTNACIFDAKNGKITEEFRFDLNNEKARELITWTNENKYNNPSAIFKVESPSNDLYLVLRVEKILQASPTNSYIKAKEEGNNNKIAGKLFKHLKENCARLSMFRQPFVWTAKPIFSLNSNRLDTNKNFSSFYKQDSNRITDEDIAKQLLSTGNEKFKSSTIVPGKVMVDIKEVESLNEVETEAIQVQSLNLIPTPNTEFVNFLYVYPKSLKFDSQSVFAKARNIAITIELRDDDSNEKSKSIRAILGRPHEPELVERVTCTVQHHNTCPNFYDEIKIALPTNLTEKHHLLFSLHHVSCNLKRDAPLTTSIGYAWLQIYPRNKVVCEPVSLSIASHLPTGYLNYQQLGLGKGFSGPDIKWCGKDLFHLDLKLVSTVFSRDANVQSFLVNATRMMNATNDFTISDSGREISKFVQIQHAMPKLLKALHTSDEVEIVRFLPILLSQLFKLIVTCTSEEVAICSVKSIFHILQTIDDEQQKVYLSNYIELIHTSNTIAGSHLHEELAKSLKIVLTCAINEEIVLLLRHIGFFLRVLVKSMAEFVIETQKIKMRRQERFSSDFCNQITQLTDALISYISSRIRDHSAEAKAANASLAHFLSRSLSLMDRGFIFNIIKSCLEAYSSSLILHELKFSFLSIITSHEHFIALNLPLKVNNFGLTRDYCKNHFLVGILLQELNTALSQVHHVRMMAIQLVRNLLAKHAFDTRYSSRVCQERIALLYFPLVTIILENLNRINISSKLIAPTIQNDNQNHTPKSSTLDIRRATIHEGQISKKSPGSYWTSLQHMHAAVSIQANDESSHENSKNTHIRSQSLTMRLDKLHQDEIRDLFTCVIYICGNLSEESLVAWFATISYTEMVDFLILLDSSILCFKYQPNLINNHSTNEERAKTLPARVILDESRDEVYSALLSVNLSTEIGLAILDVLGTFCSNFREKFLIIDDGDNEIMAKVFAIYLNLLSSSHHLDTLIRHVFASLRVFCVKFAVILFKADPQLYLSKLTSQLLQCCSSKNDLERHEATALVYWLLRCNYNYFNGKNGITITHLQIIVGVSRLLGDPAYASMMQSDKFYSSIALINNFATSDTSLNGTSFSKLITELTQRIQTILTSTAQISEQSKDLEKKADLHLQLANSYCKTCPELRRTWLESMVKFHLANGALSEAAMCLVHISAIQSEYLKEHGSKGIVGLEMYSKISRNIISDENECDFQCEQTNITESTFTTIIDDCVKMLANADRFETASQLMKVVVDLHERDANHEQLAKLYESMSKMHSRALEANRSGKRLLGTYFLVVFHGLARKDTQTFQYIYKEPKVTSLAEFSLRICDTFEHKYGQGKVNIIGDGDDTKGIDNSKAYFAITHVTPISENTRDEFERNNNINKFTFEIPFTLDGTKHAQCVSNQYRKRIVLTCAKSFPYVVKRIPVVSREEKVLTPIEVAIEEMCARTKELKEVSAGKDMKKLQLVLQGSVQVTVNAGPIAYAKAFLDNKKDDEFTLHLKHVFMEFMSACEEALKVNFHFIGNDQSEYHISLKSNFEMLRNELHNHIQDNDDDTVDGKRSSVQIFDVISGTSLA